MAILNNKTRVIKFPEPYSEIFSLFFLLPGIFFPWLGIVKVFFMLILIKMNVFLMKRYSGTLERMVAVQRGKISIHWIAVIVALFVIFYFSPTLILDTWRPKIALGANWLGYISCFIGFEVVNLLFLISFFFFKQSPLKLVYAALTLFFLSINALLYYWVLIMI